MTYMNIYDKTILKFVTTSQIQKEKTGIQYNNCLRRSDRLFTVKNARNPSVQLQHERGSSNLRDAVITCYSPKL